MEKITSFDLFNSPLEVALRLLFIFKNTRKKFIDTQRLIYYNYLLIHSSDVQDAPPSLHPDMPNRSCEILISRKIILKGLNLLLSRDLICVQYSKTGIKYKSNENTSLFLSNFESRYSKEINQRAKWISENFDLISDRNLDKFMQANLGKWGSEFSREYHIMGEDNNA